MCSAHDLHYCADFADDELFGAYRTSRNDGLKYSYFVRKPDETDYIFVMQRRSAYTKAHKVPGGSSPAYEPAAYSSQPGVTPISAALKGQLYAEVSQICEKANDKRASLAKGVAACPHQTWGEQVLGWFEGVQGSTGLILKALAFFPLLVIFPLIMILDAVSTIFFGWRRLAARRQWFEFEDLFLRPKSRHQDWTRLPSMTRSLRKCGQALCV